MNDVQPLGRLVQKRTEGMQTYSFQCLQDGKPVVPSSDYNYQASLATQESLVKTIDMQVDGTKLSFSSDQIIDVPAGMYQLEIWEMVNDNVHAIYPGNRSLEFDVIANSRDLPKGTVSSLTLDEFERRLKQATNAGGSNVSLDVANRNITVDGQTLQIPEAIDLSNLATKTDLAELVKQTELAVYLTKDSADQLYAKKDQLPDMGQYVTRTDVDTELNKMKPVRNRPVSIRAGLEDKSDYYFAFDNGSEIHFPSGTTRTALFDIDGYGNPFTGGVKAEQIMDVVTAWLFGYLDLSKLRSGNASLYYNWAGSSVKNPLYDIDGYDWSAVQLTTSSPIATSGELGFVKSWYAVGLLTANQVEELGAVKK